VVDVKSEQLGRGESMKRAAIVIAVLGMCAGSLGQGNSKPASQNPPAGQAAQPAGQAAAPQGKRPPAAKTQPEFDAYKAAAAQTDPAAVEKAADDFATKFPESELRTMLYSAAMQRYQQANNADKMIEMARKILAIDADDPAALVGIAQAVAERTHDTDLDKDERYAEAKKDAERSLVTVETDVPTSGYPPEQLNAFKNFLRSEAYLVLGTLSFKANNWPDAEVNLRKSIDALPQQPDTLAVFRLAVALDMQNKVPEAMKAIDQAVDLTKDTPDSGVGKAARAEKDRLVKLSGGTAPGQAATPPKN
jgi:tetratricopeptide (TPR) repeat protein